MRIAIPTLTTTAKITGVAEYLIHLIEELQECDGINEYFVLTSLDNSYMFRLREPNFHEIQLPLRHDPWIVMRLMYHAWHNFIFPRWCLRHRIDLVHMPNTLFVPKNLPTVVTIHDIAELKTKKYGWVRTTLRRRMIRTVIERAQGIITVSESTARDVRSLGAQNVGMIYNGFHASHVEVTDGNEILSEHGLEKKMYVLFVGTLLKHKNIDNLVRGFQQFQEVHPDFRLVLAGAFDNAYAQALDIVDSLNLSDQVKFLNYVDARSKTALLKHASMFCLLSSYEGFGFPILEAQSLGVPVIISNRSSLPEIAGDGALCVEPEDVAAISRAMQRLADEDALRKDLIQKGQDNVRRFSWSACALQTKDAYSCAAGRLTSESTRRAL